MLILEHPLRLSTDIDILCAPGTDVDRYIDNDASKFFPFKAFEEDRRIGKNNIEKRHFKFVYNSPLRNDDFYIFPDIVFAPHTTGVPLGADKELEIIKQLFDVATLSEIIGNCQNLISTYDRAVID